MNLEETIKQQDEKFEKILNNPMLRSSSNGTKIIKEDWKSYLHCRDQAIAEAVREEILDIFSKERLNWVKDSTGDIALREFKNAILNGLK